MIVTRNIRPFEGGIKTINDRAAHLVQALEKCPLEFICDTLAAFDKCNSPDTTSRSAHRWIRQFCGFENIESGKNMDPIIEVLENGKVVSERAKLKQLMKDMTNVA